MFERLKLISTSDISTVWLATDRVTQRNVILKQIHTRSKQHADAETKVRTVDLFEKLMLEPHPGVVQVKHLSIAWGENIVTVVEEDTSVNWHPLKKLWNN